MENGGYRQRRWNEIWLRTKGHVTVYVWARMRPRGCPEDHIEDVISDVALGIGESLDFIPPMPGELPYVLGIAKYKIVDHFRSEHG